MRSSKAEGDGEDDSSTSWSAGDSPIEAIPGISQGIHEETRIVHRSASESRRRKEKNAMQCASMRGLIVAGNARGSFRHFGGLRFCVSMKRLTVSLVVSTLVWVADSASAASVTDFNRFELWNDCRPMELVVENLPEDAAQIGLTEERIAIAVRSRLRAARLYEMSAPPSPYLYVNVNVFSSSHSISIRYNKFVQDLATGKIYLAPTWQRGGTGTHGEDAGYILSGVAMYMDRFIDEYLRVNEDACRS